MPDLYVRNVPDELYERIQKRAQAEGTSVAAEVISMLEQFLEGANQSQTELLAGIRRRRFFKPGEAGAPDSSALLREDRRR